MSAPRAVHRAIAMLVLGITGAADADAATQTLVVGTHAREMLRADLQRIAVGDPGVVEVAPLTSRELLVLGKHVGRTSVVVWTDDGGVVETTWRVERDLSVLASALREIYPSIRVESAPDRDAIVLRGVVPDIRYARAAEAAAQSYLQAGGSQPLLQSTAGAAPDVAPPGAETTPSGDAGQTPATAAPLEPTGFAASAGVEGLGTGGGGIINLIRVEDLPAPLEERIAAVIAPLGGDDVRVSRVVRGEVPDDAHDTFVLEGRIRDQVALVRALIAAAHLLGGAGNITVLANESGGIGSGPTSIAAAGGVGSGSSGIGSFAGSGFGFGASSAAGNAGSALSTNVGRATALSTAGGRILAFLEVEDLPQVRVEARIYEVNRTKLLTWRPEIDILGGDFDQAPLLPARTGLRIQGAAAPRVGGVDAGDVQAALSLIGGALTQQWQVVAGHFALDALFSLLEDRGLARSLAQPALTVLSGETASFQAGGQIPINVAIETQTSAESDSALFSSVVFADFGVSLSVRPLVGPDDVVTLDVVPNVSTPDLTLTAQIADATGQDQTTTSFQTRSMQTSSRLRDGQALVIGGLQSRSNTNSTRVTPWIHEVPLLGWFAKSLDEQADEQEVVIIVTPTIVRAPLPASQLWAFPSAEELLNEGVWNSARSAGTYEGEDPEP